MKGTVQKIQKHEPHRDYKPFAAYTPRFVKTEPELQEAFEKYQRIHEVHDKASEYGLEITSELMSGGKDYLDEKDAKALTKKLRKVASAKAIGDYFGLKDTDVKRELEDYLTSQLVGPESELRRRLERGERLDFDQIKAEVQNVMANMRNELLRATYTDLQAHDKKTVAQEVASLVYHYIGGPDQENRIRGLKKLVESRHVVEELMGLDRAVAEAYERVKRGSELPKEGKREAA